jgi:hypothetical protein
VNKLMALLAQLVALAYGVAFALAMVVMLMRG